MLERAREIEGKVRAWRRDFHMHPELGFQETRTAARVAEILRGLGYRVRTGVGKTGVVADFGQGSPVIAIRADMDALPIQEANEEAYASQNPGVMHACGHDAHTAIALGAATLLATEEFSGTARFLFQPAEEVADEEGVSGAPRMIADGAMAGVHRILALHVDASLPVGDIAVEEGPASGGVDTFYATIIGRGGHGARPNEVVDPIYIGAYVILALNGIVSRRLHPFDPAVVSIGTLHAGNTDNVIPDRVETSGTMRYMDLKVREEIQAEIERAFEVARTLGGDYELRFETGYPPMMNNPEVVQVIRETAAGMLGDEHILVPEKGLGAEDFSFLAQLAPGAMFRLGCRIEGDERQHHNPRFDVDEGCLAIGAAILAQVARTLCKGLKLEGFEGIKASQ